MRLIKKILLFCFLLTSIQLLSQAEIQCKVRYLTRVYHPPVPPTYYEGDIIGKTLIDSGHEGYYENVWSNTYKLTVYFFSGFELNEYYKNSNYNENAIIALIKWPNGGHSFLTIQGWVTKLKNMTVDEILYDPYRNRVTYMKGIDNENRIFEFYY